MTFYYFDALPIRPQPEHLESLTSYALRLGQSNGIKSISALSAALLGDDQLGSKKQSLDYAPRSLATFAVVSCTSEQRLLEMTCYHLGRKFGRLMKPQPMSRFLGQSVSNSLRYCPECLSEHLHYSLVWRFLSLDSCVRHSCKLLDRCHCCSKPIPLFAMPPQIGICPSCEASLSAGPSSPLTKLDLQIAQCRFLDLEFLIKPNVIEAQTDIVKLIGREFATRRRRRRLTAQFVANQIGLPINGIQGVETGNIAEKGPSVHLR